MSKTILITGTSNGFGNDTALTLAEAGNQVFATMRDLHGRNRGVADELRSKGVEVLELDVTLNASVDEAFAALFQKTSGKLDVLVNNAGLFAQGLSETYTPEQLRDIFEVNVFGMQRVMRAALPAMRKRKSGLVINVGSILGRVTIPFIGLYGATKFAVEALTESYRYELSQLGVDVVLIQPSAYPTGLYAATISPGDGARASEYGAVANMPAAFADFLKGVFSSPNAPNSHEVTEAIVKVIETPAGQRSERVLVGAGYGADAVNVAVKPIQAQMIAGIGFDQLEKLAIS